MAFETLKKATLTVVNGKCTFTTSNIVNSLEKDKIFELAAVINSFQDLYFDKITRKTYSHLKESI